MTGRLLLADIGGTNARFACADGPVIGDKRKFRTAEIPELAPVIADLARDWGAFDGAYLAFAGPVEDGSAALTNGALAVDAAALAADAGLPEIALLNDFEALAWSLPSLGPDDRRRIAGGAPRSDAASAVLGPGTGLGVAAWVPDRGGRGAVVSGEGGHVTLAARTAEEDAVVEHLRERFGHASAERVLSGPGLQGLYEFMTGAAPPAPEAIAAAACEGDSTSRAVVNGFLGFLGTVASDLVLTLGARGGVYLAGGVLAGLEDLLEASAFHTRFIDKGRFRDYLAAVPVYVLTAEDAAFRGLLNCARAGDD